jgi:hypothetical protein
VRARRGRTWELDEAPVDKLDLARRCSTADLSAWAPTKRLISCGCEPQAQSGGRATASALYTSAARAPPRSGPTM